MKVPHTRAGKNILKNGKIVQRCSSVANAKKALNLRRAGEHGWKPTGAPVRTTRKKTTKAKKATKARRGKR